MHHSDYTMTTVIFQIPFFGRVYGVGVRLELQDFRVMGVMQQRHPSSIARLRAQEFTHTGSSFLD